MNGGLQFANGLLEFYRMLGHLDDGMAQIDDALFGRRLKRHRDMLPDSARKGYRVFYSYCYGFFPISAVHASGNERRKFGPAQQGPLVVDSGPGAVSLRDNVWTSKIRF